MGCACFKGDHVKKYNDVPPAEQPEDNLVLSQRQKERFVEWKTLRSLGVADIFCRPLHYSTIRQGAVGDCSFVAVVCVLTQSSEGAALLQSAITHVSDGKFRVRLFSQGKFIEVDVDDWVPVGHGNKLIVAHSDGECWLTLLEKAFVKLMGGTYDVPGSNPNTDAYHLTGWIPETIVLSGLLDEDAEDAWRCLVSSNVVACLGTSQVHDAQNDAEWHEGVSVSTGLVQHHAYSILRVVEDPLRLLYVRNSWGKQRWKKRYGVEDTVWDAITVPEYDIDTARACDDGCFWILWTDVLRFFSHLYILRNPAHLYEVAHLPHELFDPGDHSILPGDLQCIAWSPQYRIRGPADATVHVVLTRLSQAFPSFITMHAWRAPEESPYRRLLPAHAVRDGVYSKGQSVILKVKLKEFIVSVSQHESKKPFDFSLKVFLEVAGAVDVDCLPYLMPSAAILWGKWTDRNSGGNTKHSSYSTNPSFRLTVHTKGLVVIFLESLLECSINLRLFHVHAELPAESILSSGAYTAQCCCIGPCELDAGMYTVIASTFQAGVLGDFRVDLRASDASLTPVSADHHVPHSASCGGMPRAIATAAGTQSDTHCVVDCRRHVSAGGRERTHWVDVGPSAP